MSNEKLNLSDNPHAHIRLADVRFSENVKRVDVFFEVIEQHESFSGSKVVLRLVRSIDYSQGERPSYDLAVQQTAVQLGMEFVQMSKDLGQMAEEHQLAAFKHR